jgi:hypothetical protein
LFEDLSMGIEKIPPLTLGECGLIFDYTPLFGGGVSHSLTPFVVFYSRENNSNGNKQEIQQ